MTTTNFIDKQTVIVADWLNDVDAHIYDQETVAHTASTIKNTPSGTISSETVQEAIDEIVSDLSNSSGSDLVGYISNGTNAVSKTVQDKLRDFISVKDFGAVGDGITDDTVAIQAAIDYAVVQKNVSIHVPSGRYRVDSTLAVVPNPLNTGQNHIQVTLFGDGRATQFLHYGAGALFQGTGLLHGLTFRDFSIINKRLSDVVTDAVFYFPDGNSDSDYLNLFHGVDPGETVYGTSFYVCGIDKYNDGVNFDNCYTYIRKVGYQIGKGSSVFIDNGRVVGQYPTIADGIGLYLTGGNGGVWVTGTDFISHGQGIRVSQDSGESNREIFLITGCVDSCNTGLKIVDASYVSWTGVWAASCESANIDFAPTTDAALLNLSGGTIFNAGALGVIPTGTKYGLSINQYGRADITGVTFRNNRGRGVSCNNGARTRYANISQNSFFENGDTGILNSCQVHLTGAITFKDNVLETGTGSFAVPNVLIDAPNQAKLRISNNDGYRGIGLRFALSLGASGANVTNDSGQDVTLYLREGNVQTVRVSGNPVYAFGAGASINCAVKIPAGAVFKLDYSVAPNAVWLYE